MTTRIVVAAILAGSLAAAPAQAAEDGKQVPTVVVTPVPSTGPTVAIPSAGVTVGAGATQIIVVPPPTVIVAPAPVPVAPPPLPAPPAYVASGPGGTTELHFTSNDDDQYVISVYDESPEVSDYQAKCMTPCVLLVANGTYNFMVGRHRTFDVIALGGVQYWRVEDNNLGGIITGAILTGLGGVVAFGGVLALGLESDQPSYDSYDGYYTSSNAHERTAAWTTLGLGLGAVAVGLTVWLLSYGVSRQEQAPAGYIPVADGLGVLPTLFAGQGAAGDRELGLGLALRF